MMWVLGVGVSSGLGPVLVVWARGQCGASIMMRAVFGVVWIPCPTWAHDPGAPTVFPWDILLALLAVVCSLQNVHKNNTPKNIDNKTCGM